MEIFFSVTISTYVKNSSIPPFFKMVFRDEAEIKEKGYLHRILFQVDNDDNFAYDFKNIIFS